MSLLPLYGHLSIRKKLAFARSAERLPASLLFSGARGTGKQRLALWLGQLILCQNVSKSSNEPCGLCTSCAAALKMQHPDLHWIFPRKRLKDDKPDSIRDDQAEGIAERMAANGLWTPSSGSEAIYLSSVKLMNSDAHKRPVLGKHQVFVVGDAERMVSQEGNDEAANTFLKLLEEPPSGTTLIITSSEQGALLPTIKSRVVNVRVPGLTATDMKAFLADENVRARLAYSDQDIEKLVAKAGGSPGDLLAESEHESSYANARVLLNAALAPCTPYGTQVRAAAAAIQGNLNARGAYADALDAMTVLLRDLIIQHTESGDHTRARKTAAAVNLLEQTKIHTRHNAMPMLLSYVLLDDLSALIGGNN